MSISVERTVLADMLRAHGEDDLAKRATSLSDDQLTRIGTLAAHYAWSEDAAKLGIGMSGARALSLASIDVLENTSRDLRRDCSVQARLLGESEQPDADVRAKERAFRRHAVEVKYPLTRNSVVPKDR